MAIDYTALQNTADSLLGDFGGKLTLTRTTQGSYDPATGSFTSTSNTTTQGNGAVTNFTSEERARSNIRADAKKILFTAKGLSIEPTVKDTITTLDGIEYKIINIREVKPGATNVLYIIEAAV